MESSQKNKYMRDLLMLISKMSLQDCCIDIPPEFGLRWNEISRAVRNARLPMTPASVANVLHKYATKSLTGEEVKDIIARLRLKSIAMKSRTWHVINLMEQITDEPINLLIQQLPSRVKQALKNSAHPNKKPQVQAIKLCDMIFMSVQMVTNLKEGSVVYVVSPPGEPVALVSTLHSQLLKACAQGLGYKKYEDACLNGKDIGSLLQIASSGTNAAMVTDMPEFSGAPRITRGGIDFTNTTPLKQYLSQRFGPDPPVLDSLKVSAEMEFFDREILNKIIKVTLEVKAENTLETLNRWGVTRVLLPESTLFDVFTIKSNQIHISNEDVGE